MRSRTVLSILLFLALTGCKGLAPTAKPTAVPPTPTPISPTAVLIPTPEPQPTTTTLTLWLPEELNPYSDAPGAEILLQQLAEFNQSHDDLQVEVFVKNIHGRGGMIDYLRTARDAAPSILPDLIVVGADDMATMATSNYIQPLDALLPTSQAADRFPFAVEMGTVKSQEGDGTVTVGFVIGADMQHLIYRKTPSSSPPISWTQVITPPVSFIFPAGGRDLQVNDTTLIQYMAAGGKVTDPEGNPFLDERTLLKVLTFYDDCVSTGAISPTVVLNITSAELSWERFDAGEGDMAVVQASLYWREVLASATDEPYIAASVPTRDGFPFTIAREAWAIAMVTDDPDRQALAMTLFAWLTAPDNTAEWTQAVGYLPGTRSALRMWDISEAQQAALRDLLDAAVPAPSQDVMAKVGPAMQVAVENVLTGEASPQEAARAAAQSLE
ncbi:MAG: extracellular solute-binding protein [Anaerolineae bacterium]|nr:extracellular solute-binding protein [Anaerolineae bacterium]